MAAPPAVDALFTPSVDPAAIAAEGVLSRREVDDYINSIRSLQRAAAATEAARRRLDEHRARPAAGRGWRKQERALIDELAACAAEAMRAAGRNRAMRALVNRRIRAALGAGGVTGEK
jgi:hypothetical protein